MNERRQVIADSLRLFFGVRSTQTLTDRMVDKVDEELKPEIIHWAAEYVSLPTSLLTQLARSTRLQNSR